MGLQFSRGAGDAPETARAREEAANDIGMNMHRAEERSRLQVLCGFRKHANLAAWSVCDEQSVGVDLRVSISC